MANVNVTSNAWTEISITSGTIQNISATADIELSAEQTDNSGVVLKPSELYQWDNETIYARAVTEDTGALRVVNFKRATGGGGGYVLPVASASTLGGVKVGSNLSIDASGVLSANAGGYTLPPATTSTLGGVIVGNNISVDANGEISTHAPYSLPTAAANTLGGIKVGSGLSIDASGVLSSTGGGSSDYDPVGRVVFDVVLRDGYIKANGATVADASTAVPNLLQFVQDNPSLLAANQAAYDANVGLYLYDSGTDALTLPNYIDRFMEGGNAIASLAAGLPNIKSAWISAGLIASAGATSAIYLSGVWQNGKLNNPTITDANWNTGNLTFDASKSSAIYKDSVTTVQPPAISMIAQIKY